MTEEIVTRKVEISDDVMLEGSFFPDGGQVFHLRDVVDGQFVILGKTELKDLIEVAHRWLKEAES